MSDTYKQASAQGGGKRRRRSKKRRREILRNRIIFLVVVAALLTGIGYGMAAVVRHFRAEALEAATEEEAAMHIRHFDIPEGMRDTLVFDGRYGKTFNDSQHVQVAAAQLMGIEPLDDHHAIDALVAEGRLVHVPETRLYETEEAQLPYLVPDAKALLDEIAERFGRVQDKGIRLRLTSCLRTNEFVSKLKRRNVNSVQQSCHLYGTTFDISYSKLEGRERKLLGQILYELQQSGHCYVKYERKQPCFHITVRSEPQR